MKKILGLDLVTNSIGWAVINASTNENQKELINISSSGSRIIPMDAATLAEFDKGPSKSQTADRTQFRGARRLLERCLLRRERLLRVLSILNFLPPHFSEKLNRYGKFLTDEEPQIAWIPTPEGKYQFLFREAFHEMLDEFTSIHPDLLENGKKVPYDWTLYYRKHSVKSIFYAIYQILTFAHVNLYLKLNEQLIIVT